MNKIKIINLLVICVLLGSCASNTFSPREFMRFVNDDGNGLVKRKAAGWLDVEVKFLPPEWLAYKDDLPSSEKYDNTALFSLKLKPNQDIADPLKAMSLDYADFKEKVEIVSFYMDQYIYFKKENETIKPNLVRLETLNGPTNEITFLCSFEKDQLTSKDKKDYELIMYFDGIELGCGITKFSFDASDLDRNYTLIAKK